MTKKWDFLVKALKKYHIRWKRTGGRLRDGAATRRYSWRGWGSSTGGLSPDDARGRLRGSRAYVVWTFKKAKEENQFRDVAFVGCKRGFG
jgi:hypothetical protein